MRALPARVFILVVCASVVLPLLCSNALADDAAIEKRLDQMQQMIETQQRHIEQQTHEINVLREALRKKPAPVERAQAPPATKVVKTAEPQQPKLTEAVTPANPVTPSATATNTEAPTVAANTAASAEVPQSSILKDLKVRVFGRVTLDAIYNSARPQAPGNPVFLVPKFAGGFPQNTMDFNARDSMLGVAFTGPMIGNLQSGGRITAVFFDNTNLFADRNGFLLTQSYGELFNDDWRLAAGLQLDVVAPLVPTALPFAVDGAPLGNNIKGQARVERFVPVGSDSQLTLQVALSEPLTTNKTPDISLDEDNGKPNLEGRVALGVGKPAPVAIGLLTQRPFEVAVSGMIGQLRRTSLPDDPAPRRVVSDVWLAAIDYQMNLARLLGLQGDFGFKGEAYTGRGLGNYSGGVLQSLDAVTWKAIQTKGGWVEGFVYLTSHLHNHTGIFIDDPKDGDISVVPNSLFGRTYNSALYDTLIWDLNKAFRIAVEASYRKTEYKDPATTGRLPNDGFGFQTQFQWAF